MFDVTLGEIGVLAGIGLVLVGRKDLPHAAHFAGKQVGRVVGILQGARIRADRFASDHQLKALQNEFRSGLRELDAVKAELAGAMASRGGLGATVPGVDRRSSIDSSSLPPPSAPLVTNARPPSAAAVSATETPDTLGVAYLEAAQQAEKISSADHGGFDAGTVSPHHELAPRSRSVAAVAEEEWENRGIGFRSAAERGTFGAWSGGADSVDPSRDGIKATGAVGGASILSNFIRNSLVYDQYDRTMREQDEALQSRVNKVRAEHLEKKGR